MKFRWDKKYLYWGITALLVLIGAISFYYVIFHSSNWMSGFSEFFSIIMPIIDGLVVAYLLWPIVSFLEKKVFYPLFERAKLNVNSKGRKWLRAVSILIAFVIVGACIYGFFATVIPQIIDSIRSIINQLPSYLSNLSVWLERILADNPQLEELALRYIQEYSTTFTQWLNEDIMPYINELLKTVSLSMFSFLKGIWNLIIGFIISVYLLVSKEKFTGQAKKIVYSLFSLKNANSFIEDVRLVDRTFGGFINGKILDSIIIGIICFFCTTAMDMPYPMLLSFIVGVTNVIPFFGPFLGGIPCALLVLMVDPLKAVYFTIFVIVLQQFDGNVLGPKILGDSTGLSSFWVIFSITLFGGLFGILGMIIGVPAFAVCYVMLKRRIYKGLNKKGLPTETEEYATLGHVDPISGEFVEFEEKHNADSNPSSFKNIAKRLKKSFAAENKKKSE